MTANAPVDLSGHIVSIVDSVAHNVSVQWSKLILTCEFNEHDESTVEAAFLDSSGDGVPGPDLPFETVFLFEELRDLMSSEGEDPWTRVRLEVDDARRCIANFEY